jgi:hypothetical protein
MIVLTVNNLPQPDGTTFHFREVTNDFNSQRMLAVTVKSYGLSNTATQEQ